MDEKKQKYCCVYTLSFLDEDPFYVGSTTSPKQRLTHHKQNNKQIKLVEHIAPRKEDLRMNIESWYHSQSAARRAERTLATKLHNSGIMLLNIRRPAMLSQAERLERMKAWFSSRS